MTIEADGKRVFRPGFLPGISVFQPVIRLFGLQQHIHCTYNYKVYAYLQFKYGSHLWV